MQTDDTLLSTSSLPEHGAVVSSVDMTCVVQSPAKQSSKFKYARRGRLSPAYLKRKLFLNRRRKSFSKRQKAAQVTSLIALSLPVQGMSQDKAESSSQLDHVVETKTLTMASVAGDSTFFDSKGYRYGFGYDLSYAYAKSLGVDLELKPYPSSRAALAAVAKGEADLALTTAKRPDIEKSKLSPIGLSCGDSKNLSRYHLNQSVNWSFKGTGTPLSKSASDFLCDTKQKAITSKLAAFYDQSLMQKRYNQMHFKKAMTTRLPTYRRAFQRVANQYKLDWQLLVAMGYQESHLKANAVSPTGVKGIMMLTSSTAREMGVSNRVNPEQSIRGGAKYMKLMLDKFSSVSEADRVWFALASYNMGPNAVKRIQTKLKQQGKDPNQWSHVYQYLHDNKSRNRRYVQVIHYVSRIRTYLETLKTSSNIYT